METAIRAYRILSALANYRKSDCIEAVEMDDLGLTIGYYRNSDLSSDQITIFDNGLAWFHEQTPVTLPFKDIASIKLPNEKESQSLLLTTASGVRYELPVRGRRGQFYDALEMLRFLRRVCEDIQASK